ncbi:hypothetical protein EB796_023138 [Bugula neritina]|uniref:Uncharacterized protein n=1 Tax=Bugula neritina TaxID=10212 RepID=A0A7J7IZ96_BUGNE|nr:hypothetical protein EB796_023138 [Bugula neritina]
MSSTWTSIYVILFIYFGPLCYGLFGLNNGVIQPSLLACPSYILYYYSSYLHDWYDIVDAAVTSSCLQQLWTKL